MSRFARLASVTCPDHEAVAWELARQFGHGPRIARGRDELGELATRLPTTESGEEQLAALADLAARHFWVSADDSHDVASPLLLSDVIRSGGGDPSAVAVALVAIGARAEYATDLVGDGARLLVAYPGLYHVVDPAATPGLVDAHTYGVDLEWRCAHEVAGIVLTTIRRRADLAGDLGRSVAATALLGTLPTSERPAPDLHELN